MTWAALGVVSTAVVTLWALRPDAIGMGLPRAAVPIDAQSFWEIQHVASFARSYTTVVRSTGMLIPWGKHGFVCQRPEGTMSPMLYGEVRDQLPIALSEGVRFYKRVDAGWPFAALRGESWVIGDQPPVVRGIIEHHGTTLWGFELPRGSGATSGRGRNDHDAALPARVHWSGALGNIALHATGWWMMLVLQPRLWRTVRAWRRRRRERCESCGYDLVGLVNADAPRRCPECGCCGARFG